MSLYNRNGIWWVYLVSDNGKKIRRSTKVTDKDEAEKIHAVLKSQLIQAPLSILKGNQTWSDAGKRWLGESKHKASYSRDVMVVEWSTQHIGNKKLRDINTDIIQNLISLRASAIKPSTANRYLDIIRAILRRAEREWGWLEKAPYVRMYKTSDRRIRYLTRIEAAKLLEQLPEHQRNTAEFALLTGLRQQNVLQLSWSQIDLDRNIAWIHPDQSKTRKAIAVPLNKRAVEIIKKQEGKHDSYIFTYKGNRLMQVNTKAWTKALKRAGIDDFRWHDLRHTWATWHIQSGTPLHVLQELGGWSSYSMVQRYAHLSAEHLAQYVGNVGV
jgi:integrase